MSNKNFDINKLSESSPTNPFSVPDGYFSNFSSRLEERIKKEEVPIVIGMKNIPERTLWNKVRPHLALAAAIIGFAMISFTALQVIIGENRGGQNYYDLSMIDETGIILDESVFNETYAYMEEEGEDSYTEWEEDAMIYLASNEVNLDILLSEN